MILWIFMRRMIFLLHLSCVQLSLYNYKAIRLESIMKDYWTLWNCVSKLLFIKVISKCWYKWVGPIQRQKVKSVHNIQNHAEQGNFMFLFWQIRKKIWKLCNNLIWFPKLSVQTHFTNLVSSLQCFHINSPSSD